MRASPGGLGRVVHHDVFAPATVNLTRPWLRQRIAIAVALQYVTDFADVFGLGRGCTRGNALLASRDRRLATLVAYLGFLSAFPDSHIMRKHGPAVAEQIRREASKLGAQARSRQPAEDILPDVLAWDAILKQASINPGTSADLTVATLFAYRLRNILPTARNSD